MKKPEYYFLQEGGEMGELTRNYDWSKTTLGTPDQWPQSLQTTLGILLHSAFPMFLFWGKDLLCFYNDAYRPSLGIDGKHPAVGKEAAGVWPDIWEFIYPLIEQVQSTGKAVWFEDQFLPIYRNGKMEDVYWTFSYSPVYNDDGDVGGVFVTCVESTKSVISVKRLKESEKRFQHFVRDATVGIVVLMGEELKVEIVNETYAALIGRTADELYGKELFKIIPETEAHFRSMLDKVRTTGEAIYLYDHPYMVYVNGAEKTGYLNVVYQPYKEDDGTIAGVMALCHDVTDSVRSRKHTEENEGRIREIIEGAPFPIGVYTGKEKRIAFANQSIKDVWGKGNDVIGKLYTDILPELDNQEIFQQIDSVFDTGVAFHARNQRVDLVVDGKLQPFYFNYSFTPLFDSDKNVYAVMNTAAETTDLNIAKQKVEANVKSLRNIILQAPIAMCIYRGADYVIEIANKNMFEFWGQPAEAVLHKPLFEAMPETRGQGFEEILGGVWNTGIAFNAKEMPSKLMRDGVASEVFINFALEPVYEAEGEISGIMAVAIDVTEQVVARQKIEEIVAERTRELATANQNLKRSNAELEQFAYIASHDLQEPLRKVSTYTQMLEHSLGEITEPGKGYLGKITSSTQRMTGLIRDVLSYSQLQKENREFKPVALTEVIDNIVADYELLIEQKKATVQYEALPEIEAIPLQMSQLFGNLISNALKFSEPGTPPRITITAKKLAASDRESMNFSAPKGAYYKIEVTDNGIGFDQAHAEQIFNIFQRLHGKTEYSGTGIGLAMCKKIAQNHHGDIYASGEKGKGALFVILLPAKQ